MVDVPTSPGPVFSDRVMAALADEPVPSTTGFLAPLRRLGLVAGFAASVRQARVAMATGRPMLTRAAALAYVLAVAIAGTSLLGATTVGVAGALGILGPGPTPSPTPTIALPSPSPDTLQSPMPSLAPPSPDASNEPGESGSPDASDDHGGGSGPEPSDDHGGSGGSDTSGSGTSGSDDGSGSSDGSGTPRPTDTPRPTETLKPTQTPH
jgi:uncharacterized membrane protein YgcG